MLSHSRTSCTFMADDEILYYNIACHWPSAHPFAAMQAVLASGCGESPMNMGVGISVCYAVFNSLGHAPIGPPHL